MIEKIKHIISENQRYYILNITSLGDSYSYQLIELLYKNKELTIENRFSSNDFETIINDHFKKKHPVILNFEGDNIINKKVENKVGYRNNLIFKANPEDFYFYEFHQNSVVFLSIVRKSIIDNFIQKFKELDFFIIHVSFGPFVMMNLHPFNDDQRSISSSSYQLTLLDNEINSFENKKANRENYVINGETFSLTEIPIIAAFFDYQFPNPSIVFETEFLDGNKSEYKHSQWFKKLGVFSLVFVLVALFAGHYMLNYYLQTLTEKQLQYSISQQTISTIENLKSEASLKEKILLTSGLNDTKYLTNYAADIGNSVLDNITINSIDINPTLRKIKPDEKINFDLNTIFILGECSNYKSFNDWIKKMKQFKWIKKIDIVEYSKETSNVDAFKITIKV